VVSEIKLLRPQTLAMSHMIDKNQSCAQQLKHVNTHLNIGLPESLLEETRCIKYNCIHENKLKSIISSHSTKLQNQSKFG
jgi:hypothetical protein